jgi:uncharacterized membrane protein
MSHARWSPMTASRGRMAVAWTLVVLGIIIAVLAVIAGYVKYQALDTPTVEETATAMIRDDDVREEIGFRLVDELFTRVDVQAALRERLPEDQQGLAPVLSGALRELADRAAQRALENPRLQDLWVRSVVTAQEQLVAILDDDTSALSIERGFLVLDLRPLVIQLGDQVAILGPAAERLPENAGRITIMEADQLETAQELTQLLRRLAMFLPFVVLALWGIALWLARGRRRAVLRTIGIGLIAVGILVLVVRRLGGSYVVEELVRSDSVRPAAQSAWDIITGLLADGGRTVLGLGLVALFAVWLSGPSRSATATRRETAPFLMRPEIAFGVAGLLFLLLLLWGPTAQVHRAPFVITAALALALGVEILRRQAAREFPGAAGADLSDSARSTMARMRGRPEPPSEKR